MSIFARPVSEIYAPEPPLAVRDVEPDEHHKAWGYTVGDVVDAAGSNVPPAGNTVVFRIAEGGMTEPVLVVKPEHNATFRVSVLAGQGALIRAFANGGTEVATLEEGEEVVIRPHQAYTYINTGSADLLLRDEASPAFDPSDEIQLVESYAKCDTAKPTATTPIFNRTQDGKITGVINIERSLMPPDRFYDLIDKIAGGVAKAWH